jgi:HSP20 family protein
MTTKNILKTQESAMEKPKSGSLFPESLSSFQDIDNIFEDYLNRNWFRSIRPRLASMSDLWGTYEMHAPSMDVVDKDDEVLIRVEVPGVDKKDLDVSVTDNILTVKGKSNFETKEEKDNYYRSEIRKGSFSRSLSLPANVDGTNINASMKNGLLELTIPKTKKTKPKSIKVK